MEPLTWVLFYGEPGDTIALGLKTMRNFLKLAVLFIFTQAILPGCEEDEDYPEFEVYSMAFGEGETIPERHTCDGDNVSPPLSFSDFPEETKGFAVVMEDADSPLTPFVNWIVWGIPASFGILNEDQELNAQGTVMLGTNSNEEWGYYGPCPPEDEEHSYALTVYALDENILDLREDSGKDELMQRIKKHIVGKGKLTGVYER